jgi:transposase
MVGMYIRTIARTNKDGSKVEYIQLAHNVRHPEKGYSKAEVIYSFGRKDQLDTEAIKRLVNSLCRFLSPEDALKVQQEAQGSKPFTFVESRPAGGAHLLRGLWKRLKIGACLRRALKGRNFSAPVEEGIFAMVANKALAPCSKLGVEEWLAREVYMDMDIAEPVQVHHLYRGMDFLLEHGENVQEQVFWSTANLLNLEVDLIFFDTTNTYFEIEDLGDSELKNYGHPKDKKDHLPLVTIGLAVTRQGIPVKCWVLPGNQHDAKSVEQVQRELTGWQLGRVVWVMDRGMSSEENRRILQRAGGDYILGEKLRGNKESEEALRRGGRYKTVKDNLQIKEVYLGQGATKRRFVVVHNPQEARKDQKVREKILEVLKQELQSIATLPEDKQGPARKRLLAHKSMKRYLRELKSGQIKINKAKVRDDARLDGKYLLSSSNEQLSAEDIALGYKQLLEVERAFRTMKSTLELRPVYHRKDERIRSHVLLCWLALLLVRVAEVETGLTWERIRTEMDALHLGKFFTENNRVLQYTELTNAQRNILKKLKITPPKTIKSIEMNS